jgi:hypothetical protein
MNRRLAAALVGVTIALGFGGVAGAGVTGYMTGSEPISGNTAIGGCVIRFDTLSSSGKSVIPHIYTNAAHHCVGITSVHADWANGDLVVASDQSVVSTILVGADESFAKKGLFVGPSGGGATTRIRIYDVTHHKIPAYSLKLYGPGMNLWIIAVWWTS